MPRVINWTPWVLAACACAGTPAPVVSAFTAEPASLPYDGGTVVLRWAVTGATQVEVVPGVGFLTPPSGGSTQVEVRNSTEFSLSASGPGGVTVAGASVVLACDPRPGTLIATCQVKTAGQCIDFSNLSAFDQQHLAGYCASFQGAIGSDPCPQTSRVGTCNVPPAGPKTGVLCSPRGLVLERYYPPQYTEEDARAACVAVPGALFTPG